MDDVFCLCNHIFFVLADDCVCSSRVVLEYEEEVVVFCWLHVYDVCDEADFVVVLLSLESCDAREVL